MSLRPAARKNAPEGAFDVSALRKALSDAADVARLRGGSDIDAKYSGQRTTKFEGDPIQSEVDWIMKDVDSLKQRIAIYDPTVEQKEVDQLQYRVSTVIDKILNVDPDSRLFQSERNALSRAKIELNTAAAVLHRRRPPSYRDETFYEEEEAPQPPARPQWTIVDDDYSEDEAAALTEEYAESVPAEKEEECTGPVPPTVSDLQVERQGTDGSTTADDSVWDDERFARTAAKAVLSLKELQVKQRRGGARTCPGTAAQVRSKRAEERRFILEQFEVPPTMRAVYRVVDFVQLELLALLEQMPNKGRGWAVVTKTPMPTIIGGSMRVRVSWPERQSNANFYFNVVRGTRSQHFLVQPAMRAAGYAPDPKAGGKEYHRGMTSMAMVAAYLIYRWKIATPQQRMEARNSWVTPTFEQMKQQVLDEMDADRL
jgi:hypothetical protein